MKDISGILGDFANIFNFNSPGSFVISLYLQVDNLKKSKPDYITELNSMIVEKKKGIENSPAYNRQQQKSLLDLLNKIKNHVDGYFHADSSRTLLLFAGENGLWEEIKLPILLKSKIIIDPKPHTQILRNILQNTSGYAILMVNKEKAQIFSWYLGRIREYLGAFISSVPPKVNFRSQAAFQEKNILNHLEEELHHYFKFINEKTFDLFKKGQFDYLILAGRKSLLPQFHNYLHNYLKERLIGEISAEPDSPQSLIIEKAQNFINEFENKSRQDLVEKLFSEYNANGLGVIGLPGVIDALMQEKIKTLVYDIDFIAPGYLCEKCNYITLDKDRCPYCSGKPVFYNDITDEIIEKAISQNCEIVGVSDNENLKSSGGIGAVLRYKISP